MKPCSKQKYLKIINSPPDELIRLYTIQPEIILDILNKDEVYYPDPEKIDQYLIEAYDWLKKDNCFEHYPIWFWLKRPSLRKSNNTLYVKNEFLITALIPRKRIVFTDFDDWHYVLNNCYYSPTDEDGNYSQEQKEKSWEIVYKGSNPNRIFPQCCVDGLFKSDVIKTKFLK